ncbi:MAG: TetR/AcrR family transcriptional regulator [Pseudomonadota bacterium]
MSSETSETRTKILEAALSLLEAHRGVAVRMGDIAKVAGISRQAVYLHFKTRAALLVAATHHLDALKGSEERLVASRAATSGVERLEAFIAAWAGYIPEIYPVARALLALRDTDEAAASAWDRRMADMREGCAAAVQALARDGQLAPDQTQDQATDLLWMLLSVRNWELLTIARGWPQARYLACLQTTARQLFVASVTRGS